MTALSVSTSMISWSAETLSPGWTLIATIVASAMDSPSCGMVIGTFGIIIRPEFGGLSRQSIFDSGDARSRDLGDKGSACLSRSHARAPHRADETRRRQPAQ